MCNSISGLVSKVVVSFSNVLILVLITTDFTFGGIVNEGMNLLESTFSQFPGINLQQTTTVPTTETSATNSEEPDEIDLSQYQNRIHGNIKPNEDVGMMVAQESNDHPEELGNYLEGDILIPQNDERNFKIDKAYYWPGGVLPFVIHGDYNSKELEYMRSAMMEFHEKTCIKFVPRNKSHTNYIKIESSCTGCWSYVGCLRQGNQTVNLQTSRSCGPGLEGTCVAGTGTPIHEFMHALGFEHEHNRYDRNNYIDVIYQNIQKGDEDQFDMVSSKQYSTLNTDYDYNSVMHYSDTAFSKDKNNNNVKTMIAKKSISKMGRGETFTSKDLIRVRGMYKCKGTTSSTGYTLPPLRIEKKNEEVY